MKTSIKHLQRYRQIAALCWKYGRSDLVSKMYEDTDLATDPKEPAPEVAAQPPKAGATSMAAP